MTVLTHYLACDANPGTGLAAGVALGAALMRAHLAIARQFAVAFPHAQAAVPHGVGPAASPRLGDRLILFGAEDDLSTAANGLHDLATIVTTRAIRPVRTTVAYERHVRVREAVRTRATVARELRRAERRAAARGSEISDAERAEREATLCVSRLPYVHLASLSTRRRFAIRFERMPADGPLLGRFDSFGFSLDGATVPVVG